MGSAIPALLCALCLLVAPLIVTSSSPKSRGLPPKEQVTLLSLKKAWRQSGSETWVAGTPCEKWSGVVCDNATGQVIELDVSYELDQSNKQPLSPLVAKLTGLRNLSLTGNPFRGPLPAFLGDLSFLELLDVGSCLFSGSIPSALGKLKRLTVFRAGQNAFSGQVPAFLGDLSLLEDLELNSNLLSGSLPASLGNLKNLQTFLAYGNRISGTVPNTFRGLTSLQWMDLGFNQLSRIGSNSNLGTLPNLVYLYLNNNRLRNLPDTFSKSASNLQVLAVNDNLLTGLPASLALLPALERLYAENNQLTQPLPSFLGAISTLTSLVLASCGAKGPIPPAWGNLKKLTTLDLSHNKLTGPIPASFGNFKGMWWFTVDDNQLSGTVPASLRSWLNVIWFNVSSNYLTGPLPQFPKAKGFSYKSERFTVDVTNNYFTGSPTVALDGAARCGSGDDFQMITHGNCLTTTPTVNCTAVGQRPASQCNRFCGTLTTQGQCAGKGVCLYGTSSSSSGAKAASVLGPYCECTVAGYVRQPKKQGTCVKA